MSPVDVIVWIFVAVFFCTAVVTLGGIVENFRWIRVQEKYLKGLYVALLIEIVTASITVATGVLKAENPEERSNVVKEEVEVKVKPDPEEQVENLNESTSGGSSIDQPIDGPIGN